MTPKALNIYKNQEELKAKESAVMQDISAWMQGLYVLRAIGCVLPKGSAYPEKHILVSDIDERELSDDEVEEMIQENTQIAAVNFAAWAKAANRE